MKIYIYIYHNHKPLRIRGKIKEIVKKIWNIGYVCLKDRMLISKCLSGVTIPSTRVLFLSMLQLWKVSTVRLQKHGTSICQKVLQSKSHQNLVLVWYNLFYYKKNWTKIQLYNEKVSQKLYINNIYIYKKNYKT